MNKNTSKILIIDDEEDISAFLRLHLEIDGYNVICSNNINDAIVNLKKENIALVISDIRMPDGGGEELANRIFKGSHNPPPLLFITGFTEITKEEAIDMGAIDIITKPINMSLIDSYVKKYFN